MAKAMTIGLVGFGNIGTGVVKHLQVYGDLINQRLPRPLALKSICDTDLDRDRGVSTDDYTLTSNYGDIVNDPEIDVVIELVGGTGIARDVVTSALRAGKHVVTANKALVATYGSDLFAAGRESGAHLLFEAAVGAGIPFIRALQTGLLPDQVTGLHGILNGTCNFILSNMEDYPGTEFEVVLQEAQRLGYAEPDPTLDIDGSDTAHKIAIMGGLVFNQDLRLADVFKEGITRVTAEDIAFAKSKGQTIKLLASAERGRDGNASLAVWPTFLPENHLLGRVRGVTNTLWVEAEPIGPTMFAGAGAGQGSTSSGILSDVCLLAQAGGNPALLRSLNPICYPQQASKEDHSPCGVHPSRYLRLRGGKAQPAARQLGLPVLESREGFAALAAPMQTDEERLSMIDSLGRVGILRDEICEIRVGLQPSESVLG